MASDRETIILDLQVDQGSAIQELEKTKKSIIQLKEEQKELTDAYKKGNITLEEYASETVRLEGILKKQQATYTNTQKSVTGVKTKMDDLIASNNKLANSVKASTENIRVAGVSVGDLSTKFASLASPAGAAIAVVAGLGAAYARSANGAKDLEFASNQLGAAFGLLGNNVADLVGAEGEDGEGPLTKLLNIFLKTTVIGVTDRLGITDIIEGSKDAALAVERLEDLLREEIGVRAVISDRLADNQETLSKIQDSQTDYNEKVHLAGEIISNITKNEEELVAVKQKQITELEEQRKSAKNVEAIDTKILEIGRDIANVQKDAERKRQGIVRLESNLLDTENKRLETINKQNKALEAQTAEIERAKRIRELDESLFGDKSGDISGVDDPFGTKDFKNKEIKLSNETVEVFTSNEKKKREELDKTSKAYKDYVKEQVQLTEDNFNTLAGLFSQGSEARRLFALAAIGTDTAQAISSLTAASEANPANAFTFGGAGAAQFAAGIIRILANIVAAKNFLDGGAFAGGGDFITTKPTMLLVGDNPGNRERVTVEPLSGRGKTRVNKNAGLIAMAGGGSLTFDGNKELAVASVQQSLQLKNSIKNMPTPIVSWVEGERVGKRVRFKETVSRL